MCYILNIKALGLMVSNPPPPQYPKVQPLGHDSAVNWKSCLLCFVSFMCEKTHKVWFKNLWNWLSNWDLMILTFWPLPNAPGGWGPQKCTIAYDIHVSYSHTNSGWISEKNDPSNPLRYPQCPPLGLHLGSRMKIPSDMFYIFHLWVDTQSLVTKSLELTL